MEVRKWKWADDWLRGDTFRKVEIEIFCGELILMGHNFIKLGPSAIALSEQQNILSNTEFVAVVDNISDYVTLYNNEVADRNGMGNREGTSSLGQTDAARALAQQYGVKIRRIE